MFFSKEDFLEMLGISQSNKYKRISQSEAKEMMDKLENVLILDVRTPEEFAEGHIKNAVLLPNENITNQRPQQLPDLEQTILVYCRSGRRSKFASRKLAEMGYTNIYEFGGIISWKYDITK